MLEALARNWSWLLFRATCASPIVGRESSAEFRVDIPARW